MKILLGRLFSILATVALVGLAAVRTVLDLIGYSTVSNDVGDAQNLLDTTIRWIIVQPIWPIWLVAILAVAVLTFVVWPRTIIHQYNRSIAEHAIGKEIAPERLSVMLRRVRRENPKQNSQMRLFFRAHIRNRSNHDVYVSLDEISIHVSSERCVLEQTHFPTRLMADTTTSVDFPVAVVNAWDIEAIGSIRVSIRFGKEQRRSSVDFTYSFRLMVSATEFRDDTWTTVHELPQALEEVSYASIDV